METRKGHKVSKFSVLGKNNNEIRPSLSMFKSTKDFKNGLDVSSFYAY